MQNFFGMPPKPVEKPSKRQERYTLRYPMKSTLSEEFFGRISSDSQNSRSIPTPTSSLLNNVGIEDAVVSPSKNANCCRIL